MKIRILTQNPFSVGFGGVEQQAIKYIENIKKIDPTIDISFFSWIEKDFDILHIIGIHSGINPYWIEVLKQKGVKIVISSVFYLKPNYFLDFRRPSIYKIFSFIPHHIVNWMKKLISNADLILPNSEDEVKQLKEVFGSNSEKIKVLYNGVDKDYFNGVDKNLFKEKYNLDNYILCVSNIEPRKNHLSLIEGFLQFKKEKNSLLLDFDIQGTLNKQIIEGDYNNLKLVLIGDYRGNYFKYHNQIKELIQNNQNDILHINNLKNTDEIFRSSYLKADAYFLLSSLETPGLSNIEASLAGIKLVLGECSPVKEYFKNFGIYIDGKNIKQIKKEITKIVYEKLLEYNGIIKEDLEKQNKQIEFIKNNYTWEEISKQLLTYYKNLGIKK